MKEISIFKIISTQSPHEQAQASTGTNWLCKNNPVRFCKRQDTGASCATAQMAFKELRHNQS